MHISTFFQYSGAALCCALAGQALATPLPPTNLQATPGNGQVVLTWEPPYAEGSSPVTSYRVTANGNATSCTTSGCTITGLNNGEEYLLRVMASNSHGESQAALARAFPAWRSFTLLGGITGSFQATDDTCTFGRIAAETPPASGPTAPPQGLTVPHGLLDFAIHTCPGATVVLTFQYPTSLPAGTQYWKRDRFNNWAAFAGAQVDAAAGTVTLTLKDNGPGDDDPRNGYIADPGGPAILAAPLAQAAPIPTLGGWALMLLSALAGASGLLGGRKIWNKSAANAD